MKTVAERLERVTYLEKQVGEWDQEDAVEVCQIAAKALAQVQFMRRAVELAKRQFVFYEAQHTKKPDGTGLEKAKVNREFAAMMIQTLADSGGELTTEELAAFR